MISFAVSKLLEVMSQGAGKTSTLSFSLLRDTLRVLGWDVEMLEGFAKLSSHEQFERHPQVKSWLDRHNAKAWGYAGVKEPQHFWFASQEDAERGYQNFPVKISAVPSTNLDTLTVSQVRRPQQDDQHRWVIATFGWSLGVPALKFTSKSGSVLIANMSVDSYGRIADPEKTQVPSFWTWGYKNGLQQAAKDALAGSVLSPKPLAVGDRTLDNTGTCPACMRNIKLFHEKVMRHGWNVQGGRSRGQYGQSWHTGPCFGVGYDPWEVSPQGGVDYAEYLRKVLQGLRVSLQSLHGRPSSIANPFYNPQYRFLKEPERLTPDHPRYDAALKSLIQMKDLELQSITREVSKVQARISTWSPKPLYRKVADLWTVKQPKINP